MSTLTEDADDVRKMERCQCSGDMPGHCPGPRNCPMCEVDDEVEA